LAGKSDRKRIARLVEDARGTHVRLLLDDSVKRGNGGMGNV